MEQTHQDLTRADSELRPYLAAFGLPNGSLTIVQDYLNAIFRLNCDAGTYLVRLHGNRYSVQTIEAELLWLEHLRRVSGLSVQQPRRTLDGRLVGSGPNGRHLSVLSWLNGEVVDNSRRDITHFVKLGEVMARMHSHARAWATPEKLTRPTVTTVELLSFNRKAWVQLPSDILVQARRMREQFLHLEANIGRSPEAFGLIHRDFTVRNVLFDNGIVQPIDFDDCSFGYFLFDIAIALAGPSGRRDYERCRDAFLGSYADHLSWQLSHIDALPTLMALRSVSLAFSASESLPPRDWREQWNRALKLLGE
jgi:Ser/Thr protein kinase RdoA (MazF antagonist)